MSKSNNEEFIDINQLTNEVVNAAKEDLRREDQAIHETLRISIDTLRNELQCEIEGVSTLTEEQFNAVDREFELIERGRVEQKIDTKQAVDAALIAQKEAVKEQTTASEKSIQKSEAATTKQIDSQAIAFTQALTAQTNLMNDLKERVVIIEASGIGRSSERRDQRSDRNEARAEVTKNVGYVYMFAAIMGV